jgi:hypothetical protein
MRWRGRAGQQATDASPIGLQVAGNIVLAQAQIDQCPDRQIGPWSKGIGRIGRL